MRNRVFLLGLAVAAHVDRQRAVGLRQVSFPILAVVEFDQPYTRTHRLWREAPNFQRVILRNRGHLSSYMRAWRPSSIAMR